MLRQGDVLLVSVASIDDAAVRERKTRGRIVLAEGEATGHAHAIESRRARSYASPRSRFIVIEGGRPVALRHEEHAPVHVPPGTWRIVRQREWRDEEIRRVED